MGGRFSRIQFTPDLLPSDVTGVNVFDQQTARFEFHPGPVFANVVLADEINRASPKTQSSLLECMEEGQATIDNVAHRIVLPFMIVATQNPIEYEGTYPLPEAQLDRFMMRLSLGYPSAAAEEAILESQTSRRPVRAARAGRGGRRGARHAGGRAARAGRAGAAPLRRRPRGGDARRAGRSTSARARAPASPSCAPAKALAVLRGRDYVVPQDVKDLAVRVLSHRIILSPDAGAHAQRRGGGDRPHPRGRPGAGARAMTRPTARGVALLAVAAATYVAARVLGTWELYLVALAFAAMAGVAWVLVHSGSRRLQVDRTRRAGAARRRRPAGVLRSACAAARRLPGLQVTLDGATGALGRRIGPVVVEELGTAR